MCVYINLDAYGIIHPLHVHVYHNRI